MSSFRSGFLSGICVTLAAVVCFTTAASWIELYRMSMCWSGLLGAQRTFDSYRNQHGGHYPQRLDELNPATMLLDAFRCPKARRSGLHAYLYLRPPDDTPDDTPILLCWRHPKLLALTKGGRIKEWAR